MDVESLRQAAGPVSRETYEQLLEFANQFERWNTRINLSARSTESELWERHIMDSAQLIGIAPASSRWLDVGSGGGFPGLVLAFLLRDRPGSHIDLVESNRKKTGFLQAMIGEFHLPARVNAVRIEDVKIDPEAVEVVTARALAPLDRLFALTARWLAPGGATALFHKGREYRQELSDCADKWAFDLIDHASVVSSDSVILEIRNLRRRA